MEKEYQTMEEEYQSKSKKYMVNYWIERLDGRVDKYDNENGEIVEAPTPSDAIEIGLWTKVYNRSLSNDYSPRIVRAKEDSEITEPIDSMVVSDDEWRVVEKYFNFSAHNVDETIPVGEKVKDMLDIYNVRWDDEEWCNKVVSMFAQWCEQEGWCANSYDCDSQLRDIYNDNLGEEFEDEDWIDGFGRTEREIDSFKNFICRNVPVNDIYNRQTTVDLKNKKLVSFNCVKNETKFNAEITENGKGTGLYTDYIEPNVNLVRHDIKKKLTAAESPIQMFYVTWLNKTFAASENADREKKAYKAILRYVKDNEKDFFYKNGNFRRLNDDLRGRLTAVANDGERKVKYFWTPTEKEEDW